MTWRSILFILHGHRVMMGALPVRGWRTGRDLRVEFAAPPPSLVEAGGGGLGLPGRRKTVTRRPAVPLQRSDTPAPGASTCRHC